VQHTDRKSDHPDLLKNPDIPSEEMRWIKSIKKQKNSRQKGENIQDLGVINFISLIIVFLVWMVLNWLANMMFNAFLSPAAYRVFLESKVLVFSFIGFTIILSVLVTWFTIRPLFIRGL
jgi:uncharacterized protein YqhQ